MVFPGVFLPCCLPRVQKREERSPNFEVPDIKSIISSDTVCEMMYARKNVVLFLVL